MISLTDGLIYITAVATICASPFIIAYAFSMINKLEQKLPPAQREALDYFAEKAVKHIEQTSKGTSNQKKDAAVSLIYSFFDTLKPPIPIPGYALIEAAIETVVWEMQNSGAYTGIRSERNQSSLSDWRSKPNLPSNDLHGQ